MLVIKSLSTALLLDPSRLRELPYWTSPVYIVPRLPHSDNRRHKHGKEDTPRQLHDPLLTVLFVGHGGIFF